MSNQNTSLQNTRQQSPQGSHPGQPAQPGYPGGNKRPPQKKSSSSKITVLVLVVALAAFAAWKFLPGEEIQQITEDARQKLHTITGDSATNSGTPSGSPAGSQADQSATSSTGGTLGSLQNGVTDSLTDAPNASNLSDGSESPLAIVDMTPQDRNANGPGQTEQNSHGTGNVVVAPKGVASPIIVTSPDPNAPREQKKPDHIDKALKGQLSAAATNAMGEQGAGLPTLGSRLAEGDIPTDAGRGGDSVVTSLFIRDVAHWLVNNYHTGKGTAPGRTTTTIIAANLRYGNSLKGLRHANGDTVAGREAVLNYVYSPGMMDALYRLYIDLFLNEMAIALDTRKQPLNRFQAADMYSLYANLCRQMEGALRGIADMPNMPAMVEAMHKTGQSVITANSQFAEALFLFEEARENGDESLAANLQKRVVSLSHTVEQTIQKRAQARRDLADAIKSHAGGRTPAESTLLYIAEWVHRRGPDKANATRAAADMMGRLALDMEAEARLVLRDGEPVL